MELQLLLVPPCLYSSRAGPGLCVRGERSADLQPARWPGDQRTAGAAPCRPPGGRPPAATSGKPAAIAHSQAQPR